MISSLLATGSMVGAVLALVVAEARGSSLGIQVAKPLASTAFIIIALLHGAAETGFGNWVLAALVGSWVGDLCLISRRPRWFMVGLSAFLLAHLMYAVALLQLPLATTVLVIGAAGLLVFTLGVMRWLWPHLKGPFVPAVALYLAAISVMVAVALATVPAAGYRWALAAGLFAISDLAVARHRFIVAEPINRILGLPLYYAAQWMFASGV